MARKPANRPGSAERMAFSKSPVPQREVRRAQLDLSFDNQSLLGALFGQFDANLVQVENRLGVFISARGNELHRLGEVHYVDIVFADMPFQLARQLRPFGVRRPRQVLDAERVMQLAAEAFRCDAGAEALARGVD